MTGRIDSLPGTIFNTFTVPSDFNNETNIVAMQSPSYVNFSITADSYKDATLPVNNVLFFLQESSYHIWENSDTTNNQYYFSTHPINNSSTSLLPFTPYNFHAGNTVNLSLNALSFPGGGVAPDAFLTLTNVTWSLSFAYSI